MKVIFCLILFLSSCYLIAQESEKASKIIDEVHFNLNGKKIKSRTVEGDGFGFGFGVKKYFGTNKTPGFYLALDFNKVSAFKGYEEDGYWRWSDNKIKFTTLSLSGVKQWSFGKSIKFLIDLGAFLEWEMKVDERYRVTSRDGYYNFTEHNTFSGHNIGLVGGIGLRLPINNSGITISARFKQDFSVTSTNGSYNVSYPQLVLGWCF